MKILGIDPGLAKTGWGVIRAQGGRAAYAGGGVLTTRAKLPHMERLRAIGDGLAEVLAAHTPALIAVERVFINRNYNTSLLLGEARGAALMTLLHANVPVVEISALQIKQSVTGKGRASKAQVALMVQHLLADLPQTPLPPDCTDALACALAADAMQKHRLPAAALMKHSRRKRTLRAVAKRYAG